MNLRQQNIKLFFETFFIFGAIDVLLINKLIWDRLIFVPGYESAQQNIKLLLEEFFIFGATDFLTGKEKVKIQTIIIKTS